MNKEFRPITEICLCVTEECNLACRYCFTEHHPNRMTYQVAKDTVDWLINNAKQTNKVPHITFFGGEPTLEWDTIIVPLINYIRQDLGLKLPCQFELGITSNCTLLTKERVDFLYQNDVGLLISVDGNRESQEYNRPCKNAQSSFDMVDANLDYIAKYYSEKSMFRTTIIPATCKNFCQNIDYARKKGFKSTFAIINQFEDWDDESRSILEQQMQGYADYLVYCFQNNYDFIRLRPLEQAINKIISIDLHCAQNPKLQRIEFSRIDRVCGLGGGYASINYKGDIYTCQEISSRESDNQIFNIGNIYTGIDEHKRMELAEKANSFIHTVNAKYGEEKCKKCKLAAVCDVNNCLIDNYIANKDFNKQNDARCWWNELMINTAQYICILLGDNENFKNYFKYLLTSEGGCMYER